MSADKSNELDESILVQLRVANRLLGSLLTKDMDQAAKNELAKSLMALGDLTQQEVADVLGVSQGTVSKLVGKKKDKKQAAK